MDKTDLELFKQAINEGLSNKIDSIANSCTEEIVYSDKHKLAMKTIVYGKISEKSTPSPRARRIIAIIVAAALLLTSCGIIFRNQIREIFDDLFVKLTYKDDGAPGQTIEEVYTLTYLPDGYSLDKEIIDHLTIQYTYANKENEFIIFEQRLLNSSDFFTDIESGYSQIVEIEKYDVYYRLTDKYHLYVLRNENYLMNVKSSVQLSNNEIVLILDGITAK